MKKYIIPNINIKHFGCAVTATVSGIEPQNYVTGLNGIENKSQVNIDDMRRVSIIL